jgi:hypothetical protein
MLYIMAAVRNGDTTETAVRLNAWKPDFGAPGELFPKVLHWQADRWVRAVRLRTAGRNAYDLAAVLFAPPVDLPQRLALLPKVFEMEEFLPTVLAEVTPPDRVVTHDMIEASQVFVTTALFRCIEGRYEEALAILESVARLGLMMGQNPLSSSASVYGWSIYNKVLFGLEQYAFQFMDDETDLQRVWDTLDRLKAAEKPWDPDGFLYIEGTFGNIIMDTASLSSWHAVSRRQTHYAQARLDLLRMGVAAKYHLLTANQWPQSAADFAPFLPQGLPRDPYSSGSLQFLSTTQSLVCYSVGSDGVDNHGTPDTPGDENADIVLTVARNRIYPNMRESIRAANTDDLLRQFPYGLPPDPFLGYGRSPMSTTETASGEVVIYSHGPDADHPYGRAKQPHSLQLQYDPTNGINSEGDIFVRIPKP